MLFEVYIRRKEKDAIKCQKLEWHFARTIDCLHYALDHFDLRTDYGMSICKNGRTILKFEKEHE